MWPIKRVESKFIEPYKYEYQLVLEPWRGVYPNARAVPVSVLREFADPQILNLHQTRDNDYINEIKDSIQREGLLHPMLLVMDDDGKVRLHDGYHRLAAAQRLGLDHFPTIFQRVQRIKGYGVRINERMEAIFQSWDNMWA